MADLHGNLKKKEVTPDGRRDENVFDIEQGVGIGLFVKTFTATHGASLTRVRHADCWGARASKNDWLLARDVATTDWVDVGPRPAFYLFKPFGSVGTEEYNGWLSVTGVFPINSVGIVTARDALTVQWSAQEMWRVVSEVVGSDAEEVRHTYELPEDALDWRITWAQEDLRRTGPSKSNAVPLLYRPFDTRFTYYTGRSRGFLCRPRADVMKHILAGENVALMTCRQSIGSGWEHLLATRWIADDSMVSNRTRERGYLFPVYLYPGVGSADSSLFSRWAAGKNGRTPNLDSGFVEQIASAAKLRFVSDGRGDLRETLGPEDVLAWIYAVFHSPRYRERYEAQIKLDFPRVPLPGGTNLFRQLTSAGHDLLSFHLLESPALYDTITDYAGPKNPEVGQVGWSDGTVWLDAARTNARQGHRATKPGRFGFHGVPQEVWDFHIGGYQVCHKWLKDRKGRRLSDEDVAHYQRIVMALNETVRVMAEIDEIIEANGGWPGAFQASGPTEKRPRLLRVAETSPSYDAGGRPK